MSATSFINLIGVAGFCLLFAVEMIDAGWVWAVLFIWCGCSLALTAMLWGELRQPVCVETTDADEWRDGS